MLLEDSTHFASSTPPLHKPNVSPFCGTVNDGPGSARFTFFTLLKHTVTVLALVLVYLCFQDNPV